MPQPFESMHNPYKVAWHELIVQIIATYDPTDVVGMQNDPIMKRMSILEREIIHEMQNNHEEDDESDHQAEDG